MEFWQQHNSPHITASAASSGGNQIVGFRSESARTAQAVGANADDVISSASVTCSHCATVSPADPPCCICLVSATTGLFSLLVPRQRTLFALVRWCSACSGSGSLAITTGAAANTECQGAQQQQTMWLRRQTSQNISEPGRTDPNSDRQPPVTRSQQPRTHANTANAREPGVERSDTEARKQRAVASNRIAPEQPPVSRQSGARQATVILRFSPQVVNE